MPIAPIAAGEPGGEIPPGHPAPLASSRSASKTQRPSSGRSASATFARPAFRDRDPPGQLSHPLRVPPVMTGHLAGHSRAHELAVSARMSSR